ncbi:PREDICTED: uncharacterized protein LOC108548005 [Eufriesea mexicana]|uniref:uncharacterized protein LOC108548005 n=1 Tax=Eufriesea mexicana TaxID=516756 RepID=UPI00083BD4A3|nr:PREDICTED: uncharacterized protein LOC108548005 [Eufriesea mexicana]
MDPVPSRPSRRYRNVFGIDIPIIECKREFSLPHKFPSMVNSLKNKCMLKDYKTVTIANPEVSNSLNESKSKKILSTNTIQKLRIKTKDGKDLGEVKVQFLAQKNVLNTSQVVYTQQTPTYKKNNPPNLSIASQNNGSNLLKSLGSQSHILNIQKDTTGPQYSVGSEIIVKSVSSPGLLTDINKKSDETQNENINIHHIVNEINKINQSNKLLLSNENGHKLFHNTQETVELENNNLVLLNKKKNEDLFIENKCTYDSEKKDVINESISIATKAEIPNETNVSDVKNSKTQLAKSKFPIVKCEKLSMQKTNAKEITTSSTKINKKKRRFNSNTSSRKKIIKLNNDIFSSNPTEVKRHNVNILRKPTNSTQMELHNKINDCNKSDFVVIYEKPTITDQYFNNTQDENYISVLVNNPDSCKDKIICNNKDIQNSDSKFERSNDITKKKEIEHNTEKENFSDCLSVIKEALTSVKDEQLRAKALHALAECGIGIAKEVPITPPDKLKTVHDSQIQTDVFGLLDFENFILMKADTFALERIKHRERSSINSLPLMKEVQVQTETQMQPKTKQNNYINDIDVLPMWNSVPLQDTINLDNFLNENLNNNPNTNRVKEVLSMPHSLCKKISIQLERDYEGMQHWDDNGLLNIHRAVIGDQLHTVQRLLVVLKASKTNIDVLTENGMTSLELAIKFDVSKNIVKLLLEAGAKPVLSDLLHDSAVILASKLSSPFLVDLLNYVTEPKLLNHVDLSGMAPLHYCALNGYLSGVNALIKMGADVNLQDNHSGRTPFFHALENEHTPVAQKLLEYNAIADLPNFSGQSVMSLVDEAKSLSLKVAFN